jgi:HSP20 family protein
MITLKHIHRVIQHQDGERLYLSAISDWQLNTCPNSWRPAVDVFEIDNIIVVRMEIAGMKEADFQISISQQTIMISGHRSDRSERKAFYQMEIFFGEFRAEVNITSKFLTEGAEAYYSDGFLQILLPKGNF